MTISIVALDRGGYSAHGLAEYDARYNAVIIAAQKSDETRALSVQFPEDISSVTKEESGIASTTPAIDGATFTATLSSLTAGGCIRYLVTTASGLRRMTIEVANPGRQAWDYYWR